MDNWITRHRSTWPPVPVIMNVMLRPRRVLSVAAVCLALAGMAMPEAAWSHGINGHVWASDRAIDLVTDCTVYRFLADPAVRPAAQISPAFPDSGYAADHPYGEAAHWEPWTESYRQMLVRRYPQDRSSLEFRQSVAFWMGASAHGLEDEIFDTLFIAKSEEVDGIGQDMIDTFTDFLMSAEGHATVQAPVWLPPYLPEVFADPAVGVEVHYGQIEGGMFTVREVVIGFADNPVKFDGGFAKEIPWASRHYIDPQTPGSIGHEPALVARFYEAMWKRLQGTFDPDRDLIAATVPPQGGRLLANDPGTVDSRISMVTGIGVRTGSFRERVRLVAPDGTTVPATVSDTRWGGHDDDAGRLIILHPRVPLAPDTRYTVELAAGIETVDGGRTTQAIRWSLMSACTLVDGRESCRASLHAQTPTSCRLRASAATEPTPPAGCASGGAGAFAPLALALALALRIRRRNKRRSAAIAIQTGVAP